MSIVADTGFVVAIMNSSDQWHSACLSLYRQFNIIYLPNSTLTEIAYMLRREGGNLLAADFLTKLPLMRFHLIDLNENDLQRTAELLRKYADSRLDYVDASVVAVAERLNITRILTIDQRDFRLVRPHHCDYFDIQPANP